MQLHVIKKYHYIELLEWLSPTLDLNLIENMWNIMKRKSESRKTDQYEKN